MSLIGVFVNQKNRLAKSPFFGYGVILVAAALAALLHTISKPLLDSSVSGITEINPIMLAAIMFLFNGLFFTPIKKEVNSKGELDRRNIFFLTVLGILEISAIITYFFGLKESTAVNASILTNGEILFTILIAVAIYRDGIERKEMGPFSMIITGIILLPIGYDLYTTGLVFTDLVFGDILLILSGVFVALDINLCRYITHKLGPKKITQWVSFIGAGFAFLMVLVFQIPFNIEIQQLPSIVIIGLFGTGMTTFLFLIALRTIGTVRTMLLFSSTSVFGVVFANLVLHESITLTNVTSIILVSAGLYILRYRLGKNEINQKTMNIPSKNLNFNKLCGNCTHQSCCTNFARPVVFSHDLADLASIEKDGSKFIQKIKINGKDVNIIKKKENSNECVFWDSDTKRCTIYEKKPFDCRAYPFDIRFIDGKYRWIVYLCNLDSDWTWSEKYLEMLENDKQFSEVIEKIDIFTDPTINALDKSQLIPFTVLREVNIKNINRTNTI